MCDHKKVIRQFMAPCNNDYGWIPSQKKYFQALMTLVYITSWLPKVNHSPIPGSKALHRLGTLTSCSRQCTFM